MRNFEQVACVFVVSLALGACSSVDGAAGDPVEAGAGTVAPPRTSDAGTTVSAGDAGNIPPAADAGHDGDAGGTVGCPGLFCEDFESGTIRPSVWTKTQVDTGNTVGVQTSHVAHGAYAARFHAKGGTSWALMLAENLPAALHGHMFGRAYYSASDFPTESGGHTAYVWTSHTTAGFPYTDHHLEIGSYVSQGKPMWQLTSWTGDGAEYPSAGGSIPKATFFCLEWEINDAPDAIHVWVNGDGATLGFASDPIHGADSLLGGNMDTLGLGFRTFHPKGAPDIDIDVDDLVLDTKRIGCL
jgi:hypothetical protein